MHLIKAPEMYAIPLRLRALRSPSSLGAGGASKALTSEEGNGAYFRIWCDVSRVNGNNTSVPTIK